MITIDTAMKQYLDECKHQKLLSEKSIRAYRSDLQQFCSLIQKKDPEQIERYDIEVYVRKVLVIYKPKTAKRKISSVKSFFHYILLLIVK